MNQIKLLFILVVLLPCLDGNAQILKTIGKAGQDLIDVGRGKKNPVKIAKHWFDESKDELEKIVGEGLKLNGELVEFVGESGEKLFEVTQDASEALIKVNGKFVDLAPAVIDEITPDGPWRISLGVVEIKSHKSIDERLKQYNNQFEQEITKASTIINDALTIAAQGTRYTGTITKELGKYLAASSEGFPAAYDNRIEDLITYDRSIEVSHNVLNKLVHNLTKQPFKYGDADKEYFQINHLSFTLNETLNSLTLNINDGTIGWDGGDIRGAIKIRSAQIQLIPKIIKTENGFHLVMGARMIGLNLKDFPPEFDKIIAWAIQDKAFAKPIMHESIDEITTINNTVSIKGLKITDSSFLQQNRHIMINSANAVAKLNANEFVIQIINDKVTTTQTNLTPVTDSPIEKGEAFIKRSIKNKIGLNYPKPPVYETPSVSQRDMVYSFSDETLKNYFISLLTSGTTFPLDDELNKNFSNHYVQIMKLKEMSITDQNTIKVTLAAGVHFRKILGAIKVNLTIEELELQFVPLISKKDSTFFLTFNCAVTNLKINHTNQLFEKSIANLILTKGMNNIREDMTNNLTLMVMHPVDKEKNIFPRFNQVGLFIKNKKMSLVASVK